ncbi:MAG: PaaI family thioesterase [Novosphingobium sp.]|nr:PaaI family thioesterase [Novosphingobium sp.]
MNSPLDPTRTRPIVPPGTAFDPALFNETMRSFGHTGFLGIEYCAHGHNWIELALPWREDLVGDVETGVIASGPIVSLLDNATSMSVWAFRTTFNPQVTLDLRVDYVRAATPGKTVIGWAECYQLKRSMAFVRGIAHDGDVSDPVAQAAGIFIQVEAESWARMPEATA